ncbi:DUF6600 domain-containing protein [Lunatibacter salilacus]|uniref:DUF6600 domain-containing protein n=1 Tax=Lunatibacter salilacus TaxID=2483804 RepID=UPI00131AF933|nr:DUF6600 domain-containing protein [Lunatibacter salilacus]
MRTFIINRLSNFQFVGWVFISMLIYGSLNRVDASVAPMNVSFQVFYDELSPYGDWVSDPTHGYVWIPYVDAGFQPYQTNGYWVNSRFGNTWVSLYDWGWAPFHYGRWFFTDFYGWAWVPGYEWAPAWVSWRTGRGYYGWAPLWPSIGVHVSIGFPMHHWVFVPRRRFLARNIYNYYIPQRNVAVIYNRTTIINNTYIYNNRTYVAGPSRTELQRVTRSNVPVYEVSNGRRPGRTLVENKRVQIYQPQLESANSRSNSQSSRPARVYTSDEYSSRRASAAPARTSETASSQRAIEQSGRRSATVPGTTNPRTVDSSTNQNRNSLGAAQRAQDGTTQIPESRRNVERNAASSSNSRISNGGRNAGTAPVSVEVAPQQRQGVSTTMSPSNRQQTAPNRISQGQAPPSQRGVVSGQRQVTRPTAAPNQRSVNEPRQPQARPQAAPSQRQVTAAPSRQSVNTPNRNSQLNTNSRRQTAAPSSRSQVNRAPSPQSRTSAPSVRSSGGSQSRTNVQAPRQSRSTSGGTTTRSATGNSRRGN